MGLFIARSTLRWPVRLCIAVAILTGGSWLILNLPHHNSAPKLLQRALAFADLNNWNEAESEFRGAAEVFRKNGDHRGELYTRLGIIRATAQRRNLADTVAQLDDMLEAEPLLKSDRELRMFCLIVRGDFNGEMKSSAMRKDWEEVAELAKQLGDRKWQNRARAELGFAAFYDGDIATCKRNVLTALVVAIGTGDVGEQIKLLYAIGLGLSSGKDYSEANRFLDRAISLSLKTPDAPYPFMVMLTKAAALAHMGKISEAKQILAALRAGDRQHLTLTYEAAALTTAGEISLLQGNLSEAADNYGRSETLLRTGAYLRALTLTQLALAKIYVKQNDLQSAVDALSRATSNLQMTGEIDRVPEQLQTLAELKVNEHKYDEAEQAYKKAEQLVDAAIYSDPSILDKTTWISSSSNLYVQHFALIADHSGSVERAFSVIEQVRGRVTTDLLIGGTRSTISARQNEHAISEARFALRSATTASEIRRINDELFLLEQNRWITPELDILRANARSQIALLTVQRALSRDATILEYVLDDPNSYCIVITRKRANIIRLTNRRTIEALVSDYLITVRERRPATKLSRQLYDALIQPLGAPTNASNLLIVRDGQLHLLPFEALVSSNQDYLGERSVVAYLPSAASFYLLARRSRRIRPSNRELLAVGGVAYKAHEDELRNLFTARGGAPMKLTNLPTSSDEVRIADAAFPRADNKLLMGTAATKAAFQHQPLQDFRFLHLAVHGVSERDRPNRSALVLLEDGAVGVDGLLQAPEIAQLQLQADLVVLSACETGIGKVQGQEGIENLAHSFVLAGASSVISTLWSIDDTFSLALIKQFYQHYRNTDSAADALALAKRDILHEYGHDINPFYWAAFTFEGVPKTAISKYESYTKPNPNASSIASTRSNRSRDREARP